jgi:hypoxanthine phosphoribosyltransferase
MGFPEDMIPPAAVPVLYAPEVIAARVASLATEIRAALGEEFLLVALLKGSFVFAADLVRALHGAGCHPQIDFMTLSSYGDAKESSGNVLLLRGMSDAVAGRRLLLVDDILESGRSLNHARAALRERGAAEISLAVLLEKPGKRAVEITAEFVGFSIPDRFVVGYGLDYANYYRELPFIGVLD